MALMKRVTRRGEFLDLGQMDRTEFRAWWRSMLREGVADGWLLLDSYECVGPAGWTAVAYVEDGRNVPDAEDWWLQETDGECTFVVMVWNNSEKRWKVV